MKRYIYTVRSCRWGDRETHSYIVGVYEDKHSAQQAAENEEQWRGGKYECEILEFELGSRDSNLEDPCMPHKIIKALPDINTLKQRPNVGQSHH